MAEQSGGPRFEEVGHVEPNGSVRATDRGIVQQKPKPPATPIWMLAAVAVGAVILTLVVAFVGYRLFLAPGQTSTAPATPLAVQPTTPAQTSQTGPAAGVTVGAAPTLVSQSTPGSLPTLAGQGKQEAQAASGAGNSPACTAALADAQSLAQSRRWSDDIARLEAVRGQCDVVAPLYDAYLNQGRTYASDERPDDAVSMFDKALQVKNGTEADTERALAVAYQDGRTALSNGDFDSAIDKLGRVQSAQSDYARGNNTLNLINAYLSKGDALAGQTQCAEALTYFQRALALKPNESAITQRVSSAQQCSQPTLVPAPAAPPPVAPLPVAPAAVAAPAVSTQPLEATVRAYYQAINDRRFGDAYSVLSSSAQAGQSLANFAGRFNATRSIGVRYVDGVSIQGSSAGLNAHTQTVTSGSAGLSTSCSRVIWVLVAEGGQWRRDIRSESSNELSEHC